MAISEFTRSVQPGQRFSRLVAAIQLDEQGEARWLCVCDCGLTRIVLQRYLLSGNTTSCGCYQRESTSKRSKRHGATGTAEYSTWQGMKARCLNPNSIGYAFYGGRGITVCDRWLKSFPAFLNDMGMRPSAEHSIDRIDPNGNYEPGNCRWAPPDIQQVNKRPRTKRVVEPSKCTVEDCLENTKARGLCSFHYWRWYRANAKMDTTNSRPAVDLAGQQFGQLVAVERVVGPFPAGPWWLCRCECGATTTVTSGNLINGRTVSCGCVQDRRRIESHTTHGLTKSAEYAIWNQINQRCHNPRSKSYVSNGGRGITICERWQSFAAFYSDMGQRPSTQHRLARINKNGNYEPSNCAWLM